MMGIDSPNSKLLDIHILLAWSAMITSNTPITKRIGSPVIQDIPGESFPWGIPFSRI
jgi:hypothetical protein